MADNQEEMEKDMQTKLNSNMVSRDVFPAVAGIADNIQQETPKDIPNGSVPKFLREDLRDYPEPERVISNAGTFGVVLKVYSALIGKAALKEPRNVEHQDKEKRWDREIGCIYSVRFSAYFPFKFKLNHHPNIVTLYGYVYDAFSDPRPRGLLMEFMHGVVEKYVANKREPLPEDVKNTWSKQIALGLNFMHSRDIMHRDLKPNNILLNQSHFIAKIADFGLSRTVDIVGEHTNNIGNPLYTAPEVYSDNTKYNKPADVWSYGMLLYFIYYLRHPFDPSFVKKSSYMRSRLLSGEETQTPLRPPLQGKNIDVIIEECWQSEPQDRCSMIKVVNAFHSQSGVQHFPSLDV